MRRLSESFMRDLGDPAGLLHPILERVKKDHTLLLAIREDTINIYYRGGNILRVQEHPRGYYLASFDDKYNLSGVLIPPSPEEITAWQHTAAWIDSLPMRKRAMDEYFAIYGKAEREFQQLIARENNNSTISNQSEYFISDIEVNEPNARFDMMAIRWLSAQRKRGNQCKAALIEVKYGDGALGGSAGLLKHLIDMEKLVSDRERYANVLATMQNQFNQRDALGLLQFNKGTSNAKVELKASDTPEVIFILANHNPRSPKLKTILSDPAIDRYAGSGLFDLRFFAASFAGYGLHASCMLPLAEFRKLL